ncbi:447_t:CDS:2, partial [Gigaspora margarita]
NGTEEIVFINLIEYVSNKISNLEEGSGISFNLCIELDNNTLTNAHHDTKLLVKLIVDEIEEEHEYKELNCKRIDRFDCHGKLTVGVDIAAKEAKVKLNHGIQHEKPVDVTTPEEIKREIMHNLHMDPVQLRTHIRQRFDTLQVTPKQIYYWWSTFNQQFFKLDENPFTSTHRFFYNPNNNGKGFELYGIISSVHSAGLLVVYLMLNTTNASENVQTGLKTKALTGFLSSLCNKGLQP